MPEEIECEKCNEPLIKIFPLSSFILKGDGWARDNYKGRKNAN